MFSTFDDCVDQYRVYKVETIGDSYLVGSGVPNRIGDEHAAGTLYKHSVYIECMATDTVLILAHPKFYVVTAIL